MSHAHGRIHPWDTLQIYDAQLITFCYLIHQVFNEHRLPNRKRGEENPVNLFWRIYSFQRTLFWEKYTLNQGVCNWLMSQFDLMVLGCHYQMVFISSKQRKQKLVQKLASLRINLMRAAFSSHFSFMPVGDEKAVCFIIVVHTAIPHCRIHDDCIFERVSPQGLQLFIFQETQDL